MDNTCINCTFFEEGLCILHSVGCERMVKYPHTHTCEDFEPYDDVVDDVEIDDED